MADLPFAAAAAGPGSEGSANNEKETNINVSLSSKLTAGESPAFIVEGPASLILDGGSRGEETEIEKEEDEMDNNNNSSGLEDSSLSSVVNVEDGDAAVVIPSPTSLAADDSSRASLTSGDGGRGSGVLSASSSGQMQQQRFNIETLRYHLEACVKDPSGEIDLDSYLNAYREICKLLDNFPNLIRDNIGRDIKTKIALMRRYKSGDYAPFYKTIDKMITFEKVRRLYVLNPEENGSRIILSLHRSLNFVAEFMTNLNTLKPDQGVGSAGREAYNRTLAPFHQWACRHIARIAFLTVGKKNQLVANFHDGSMSSAQVKEAIEGVVRAATEVYTRCQVLYEKNNFLNIL